MLGAVIYPHGNDRINIVISDDGVKKKVIVVTKEDGVVDAKVYNQEVN